MKNDNHNPIDRDDPRLTAYALGEGTPEERAEVEAALAADASLAEEIESIRQTAALLETTLAAEPLLEKKTPMVVLANRKWHQRPLPRLGIVAACVCLLIVLVVSALQAPREAAHNTSHYFYDGDVQYFPQSESNAENKESAPTCEAPVELRMKSLTAEHFSFKEGKSAGTSSVTVPNKKTLGVDHRSVTVGTSLPGVFTSDLKIPFLENQATKAKRRKGRGEFGKPMLNGIPYKPGRLAKNVGLGRETQSLMATVTPRIIIQEEEEEKIGMPPAQQPALRESIKTKTDYVVGKRVWKTKTKEKEGKSAPEPHYTITKPVWETLNRGSNTEAYDQIVENEFKRVSDEALSTFSIDVDTASYSNVRRYLNQGSLPPKGAVRIEEMVNYFKYHYTPPKAGDKTPFAAHMAVAECPWNKKHQLVRVALKGKEVKKEERPAMNLVFLLDVSGSMSSSNKLPLVKEGMKKLVRQLDERDRIAIVVYAGASGLALPSTAVTPDGQDKILAALDNLHAGGSTNGGAGIKLAYATAAENFTKEGVNRVILCTDGDFNVGTTNQSDLVNLIEKKAKEKVFLTVLGFGMGNYKGSTLEKLADKGNGNYGYIDNLAEAEKLLVRQMLGTLVAIAKDVKIQVEFNPKKVKGYRLLGYENRVMAKEDFNDDTKDAGEIGAGHTVTAFYELIPAGSDETIGPPAVDPLKYQPKPNAKEKKAPQKDAEETTNFSNEILTLKLRYKQPDEDTSTKVTFPLVAPEKMPRFDQVDDDFRFAGSVVGLAMLLRDSKFKGTATYAAMLDWAEGAQGDDPHGYRREFLQLMRKAQSLSSK